MRGLAPEAVEVLRRYPWPGNVRELEHAISRAVVFARDGTIRPSDLGLPSPRALAASGSEIADRSGSAGAARLTRRQQEILEMVAIRGVVRSADLSGRFGLSGETLRRDLATLVDRRLLRREGTTRGTRYRTPAG